MQRRGDRVLGPYADGKGRFRIIVISEGKKACATFATRGEAEAQALDARAELAAVDSPTIEEAIVSYKVHLREKRDKEVTVALAERFLRMYFVDTSPLLADLTPVCMQRLYDDLRKRPTRRGTPPADATHQQALVQAQALLAWACTRRLYRDPDPAKGIKPIGKRRRGKPQLRIDEARKWLTVALGEAERQPGALAAVVALLMGLRAGEVVSRTVRDLDDGGRILWVTGKTNDDAAPRQVEVPDVLQPLLLAACAGKAPTARIIPREVDAVAWWARKICKLAGIAVPRDEAHRLCAHSLRGTHATLAVQAGQSAHVVAGALGHSARVLRESYAVAGSEAVAAARRAQLRLVQ